MAEVLKIRRRKGNMYDKDINSQFLNEIKTLKIYEPESYSPNEPFHIFIMQDGNDYYQLGRMATLSDQLHTDGVLTNTVLVGIHYIDKADRRKKYHPDGDQYDAYIQFLTDEVVPLLDQLLPINQHEVYRALIGDSLAGTIALMGVISHPELFQKAILQSPLVDETILSRVTFSSSDIMDVYHTIGTNETNVPTSDNQYVDFVTPNRELNALLQMRVDNYTYKEIDKGEHMWKYWQKDMENAVKAILS